MAATHSCNFFTLKARLGKRVSETVLGDVQSRVFISSDIVAPHSVKILSKDLHSFKSASFMLGNH